MMKRIFDFLYLVDVGYPEIPETFASYIIFDEKVAIVDPGPAKHATKLIKAIDELGFKREDVEFILLTHIHLDHAGGASKLLKAFPNAKIYVHPRGKKHLVNPSKLNEASKQVLGEELLSLVGEAEPVPEEKVVEVKDYGVIVLGENICLLAVHTPGHASHHVAYFTDANDVLFVGDMAGALIRGHLVPSTPPPFKLNAALQSLRKVMILRPVNLAYPHFGVHDRGFDRLMEYYGRLNYWADVIKELAAEGRSKDEIYEFLIRYDHTAREAQKILEVNPWFKDDLRRSFEGFYSCVLPVA